MKINKNEKNIIKNDFIKIVKPIANQILVSDEELSILFDILYDIVNKKESYWIY